MTNRTLRIHVVDQHRRAYNAPVVVEVKHRTLASEPVKRVSHNTGACVDVEGLLEPPKGDYQITVTSQDGKKYVSQFLNIAGKGGATVTVTLENGQPCKQPPPLQLPGKVKIPLGPAFEKESDWKAYTEANPLIPRKLDNMLAVARRLFPRQATNNAETNGALRNLDDCAESLFSHFLLGLKNPVFQSKGSIQQIEGAIAEAELTPVDAQRSNHFEVIWYAKPPEWADSFLEDIDQICDAMVCDFREPYLGEKPPKRIPLHIRDLRRIRGMTSVESPEIYLNRRFLDNPFGDLPAQQRGDERKQRQALVAHELFHRVEYAYGFRRLQLELPFQWYSEGLASWAEIQYGETITSDQKMLGFTKVSRAGLYGASYFAMPFWYDVEKHEKLGKPLLKGFLEEFERNGGNGKSALKDAFDAFGQEFFRYYSQWASDQMGKSRPVRGASGVQTAEAHNLPLFVQHGRPDLELARRAEFRGTARELSIFQLGTNLLDKEWRQTGDQPPTNVSAKVNGRDVQPIRHGMHRLLVTVVAPEEGEIFVISESTGQGPSLSVLPAPSTHRSHVLRDSPPYKVTVDEFGNVTIEKKKTDGETATTVLGYSYNPGWNTNHSSLAWSGDLTKPASVGELVNNEEKWPPSFSGPEVSVPVQARWQNGEIVKNVVTRRIKISGHRITIDTTLVDADTELNLIQRSISFGSAELADHDGGANSDCRGDDCDPIVGATMAHDPELVNPRPGARLQIGQPWWPAPGWVLLPTTYSGGGEHTIRQVYCLEGKCG